MNAGKSSVFKRELVMPATTMTLEEWYAEGERRFGKDRMQWRFTCPSCGHDACAKDWRDAKAPEGTIAFSCVGRWLKADDKNTFERKGGPCQYSGGGLFRLNPITVIDPEGKEHHVFNFALSSATGQTTVKSRADQS